MGKRINTSDSSVRKLALIMTIVVFFVTVIATITIIIVSLNGSDSAAREKLIMEKTQTQQHIELDALIAAPHAKNVVLDTDTTLPTSQRTIWLLWFQGWEQAPWVARAVATSWAKHNVDWTIRLVSDSNLRQLLPETPYMWQVTSAAARSDIVRLSLLSRYGGVWADATMICFMPLDTWVCEALRPVGLWMYRGGQDDTGPASWFILSIKGNYLIQKWKEACDAYWTGSGDDEDGRRPRTAEHDYYWMDGLFMDLLNGDPMFKEEWGRVPYLSCTDYGQAQMLGGRVLDKDPDLIDVIYKRPPYAIKLKRQFIPSFEEVQGTNMYAAIDSALRPRWLMSNPNAPFGVVHKLQLLSDATSAPRPDVTKVLSDQLRCN
jgi:hypothetical protein